jgi:hypothetical protein
MRSQNCEKRLLVSSCPSVRQIVRSHGITRHPLDRFQEIWVFFFRKYAEKIQVPLKLDKNNWFFTWRLIYIFIISRWILRRMRNVLGKSRREIKTRSLYSIIFFASGAVCEIMWENIVQPGRPHKTIRRTRIACWIIRATDTHSEHVILIKFPLQKLLLELASMFRWHVRCLCCCDLRKTFPSSSKQCY